MEKEQEKYTLKQLLWYIVIFSVIGLAIETIFCYATTGVLESRKGLIWGPFCPVYGVGATILIVALSSYKKNGFKLFIVGCILGNIIEYGLSYLLEAMYGTRFWDYAYLDWNLNGRICFKYSIFWGILAVILIKFIQPYIDKIIAKIPNYKPLHIGVFIFLVIDCIATVWAVNTYQNRVAKNYNNIENTEKKSIKQYIEDNLFSNKIMKKTFPNLRYIDENGKEYYIRNLLKND